MLVAARAARTSRPFSDEPVKITLSTPSAMASRAASTSLGQDREQRGIESGGARELREKQSETARAGRGLEQDSIAGDERVERMNRGKKERIISRPDHKHDAERLALHFKRNALQPERTSAFSTATRREHAGGVALQPAARIGERENFGDELLGDGSIARPRRPRWRASPRSPRSGGEVRG